MSNTHTFHFNLVLLKPQLGDSFTFDFDLEKIHNAETDLEVMPNVKFTIGWRENLSFPSAASPVVQKTIQGI